MPSAGTRTTALSRRTVTGTLLPPLMVAGWLLGSGVLGGPGTPSSVSSTPPPADGLVAVASRSYVVQAGDTLWSVARSAQPQGDVRPLVDLLARHTGGRPLRAGQRLPLP